MFFQYGNEIYAGAGFSGYGFGHEFWKYYPVQDSLDSNNILD